MQRIIKNNPHPSIPSCPRCGAIMMPVYQNNGYTMPNGPEKIEITEWKCEKCGFEDY